MSGNDDDDIFGDDDFDDSLVEAVERAEVAGTQTHYKHDNKKEDKEEEDVFDDDLDLSQVDEVLEEKIKDTDKTEQGDGDSNKSGNDGDDEIMDPPPAACLSKLRHFFGHGAFKPKQWQIISGVLEAQRYRCNLVNVHFLYIHAYNCRDQCVVMATGYGKSLCYQVLL